MSLNVEENKLLKLETSVNFYKNLMVAAVNILAAALYPIAKYLGVTQPVGFNWFQILSLLIAALGVFHLLKAVYLFIKLKQMK